MDTDKEKAMTIYLTDNPIKFIDMENGLYARLPKNLNNNKITDLSNAHLHFTTVEEKLFFSPKQIERAKAARKIFIYNGNSINTRFKNSHNNELRER